MNSQNAHSSVIDAIVKYTGNKCDEVGSARLTAIEQRRAKEHGLTRDAYAKLVLQNPSELHLLAEEYLVVESWLWREIEPIKAALTELQKTSSQLRILSIPCARGEEAITTLALALSIGFSLENLSVEGYDLSSIALKTAKSGRLIKSAVRGDFPIYLSPLVEAVDSEYCYREEAKSRCLFKKGNILSPDWIPNQQQYDLILCRNLLIYLDKTSQDTLLGKLKGLLSPHGQLVLATAEMPLLSNLTSLPNVVPSDIRKQKGNKKKCARGLRFSGSKKPARVVKTSTPCATTNLPNVTCEDACEQLLRYLDENPHSGRAMSELGFLLSSLNKTELAICALERALALDASLEEARILVETLKLSPRNEV